MRGIIRFIIGIIIIIVLWHNFDKIITIGDILISKLYHLLIG